MESEKLNSILVTAVEALKLLVELPRKMMPNGDMIIVTGKYDKQMGDAQQWRFLEAKNALESIPDLSLLLETRVLEIKQREIQQRLNQIRGKNGRKRKSRKKVIRK